MTDLPASSKKTHPGRSDWHRLSREIAAGRCMTEQEALGALHVPPDELLELLQAAYRLRAQHFGRDVNIHILKNAKSGLCPEDCSFCSQSLRFATGTKRHRMASAQELVSDAERAERAGAVTYCMVTSTRSLGESDLATLLEAAGAIKRSTNLRICVSAGMLDDSDAARLKAAGVDRYNHNIETARAFFSEVVSTHTFDDRIATIRRVKTAGMELCSGGILGLGESARHRVQMAFTLRELDADSIPLNFLDPRPNTPLADAERLAPGDCLRALAMFRLVNPSKDIRVAGGREKALRTAQPLALYAATSLFANGYLTTGGQGLVADMQMIEDAGFRVAQIEPA